MGFWANFLIMLAALWVFVLGCLLGYHVGVQETERRWSEAVAKGDADRNWQEQA